VSRLLGETAQVVLVSRGRALWRIGICVLTTLVVGLAAVWSDEAAWERLEASIRAAGNVAYLGIRDIVIFDKGRKVSGYQQKITRMPGNRERIVVLYPPDQRGRLKVCNGSEVWEYWPHQNKVIHQQLRPFAEQRQQRLAVLSSLKRTLEARSLGDGIVAGRLCHIIAFSDYSGRLVRKVWLDGLTTVELKVQRFGSDERLAYSSYYTTINFHPQLDETMFVFEVPEGAIVRELPPPPQRMTLADAQAKVGFRALVPARLPPGYVFQQDQVAVNDHRGQPLLWLPFTNGVDTFSLFQSPAPLQCETSVRSRVVTWTQGGYSFVLVGTLSNKEIRSIQRSMPDGR